ncbi:hypothetical protein A3I95_01575 [Candidatus Nomurabacteria bacterium RIFCSPLOWO2_02_FULL_44_12]|uniref:Uncharacterized protein n=1 Tax=Candidatus Nomurabacteria bacterium RIFCSPLOWO2_12_FULL_44_11 TaxID=1801796 RepID=A0A1F6Y696_9BACT|nr:MAG: hypothetical protein A3E95_00355 [Candidatus Nomurabacteria bacterium RIFCSPHIGHO2_12_FULL_44_22b]OGJ01910.1 MAG: hypothetical protein A3G53_01320 [Candidatus Nomurabacteria bacterium RIFCSPLOWO2_12_FULL_44_11]OGJ08567.1 MAG: hypothetical protein A3I95_01575 [Candidatus Nomurabacteria bacterium RIFCSPLOWO2_02_FULL_44_12]
MNPEQIRSLKKALAKPLEISMGREFDFFTKVNEALSYGIDGNVMHIHLRNISRYDYTEKEKLVIDGLRKLASVVSENVKIRTIRATSPLVARYPRQLKKLGLKTTGQISEELRLKYFKEETLPVHEAIMTREEFLAIYSSGPK